MSDMRLLGVGDSENIVVLCEVLGGREGNRALGHRYGDCAQMKTRGDGSSGEF